MHSSTHHSISNSESVGFGTQRNVNDLFLEYDSRLVGKLLSGDSPPSLSRKILSSVGLVEKRYRRDRA